MKADQISEKSVRWSDESKIKHFCMLINTYWCDKLFSLQSQKSIFTFRVNSRFPTFFVWNVRSFDEAREKSDKWRNVRW